MGQAAGCIIGTDYPAPVVDHDTIHKENISRMAAAYKACREAAGGGGAGGGDEGAGDDDEEEAPAKKKKGAAAPKADRGKGAKK